MPVWSNYMNKTKFRSLTIAALIAALALVLTFAIGSLSVFRRASAVYRPSEIFTAGENGSVDASEHGEGEDSYLQLSLNAEEGKVHFRRDLALRWYAPAPAAEEDEEPGESQEEPEVQRANPGVVKYFSFTFSFPEINFTRLSLVFESVEENFSKKSTSRNALVFSYEGNVLKAAIRTSSEQPDDDAAEEDDDWEFPAENTVIENATADLALTIDEEGCDPGEFALRVNGALVGKLTNVGGYFLDYLSSASSTPRDPMTFVADKLKEGENISQKILVKQLNGQSFKLDENDRVVDDADPVLVVSEQIFPYTLGKKWSLSCELIDVCDSSVSVTRKYAMVNAPDENGLYPKPVADDYATLSTSTAFLPTSDDQSETQYVSIYFELDDGRTLTDAEKEASRIYLTWYAAPNAVVTLNSAQLRRCPKCGYEINLKEYDELSDDWVCPNSSDVADHGEVKKADLELVDGEPFDYFIVDREKETPHYIDLVADEATQTNHFAEGALLDTEDVDGDGDTEELLIFAEYQKLIDERTTETDENGKTKSSLSAGSGSYFYLPSMRNLVESERADYRNLRFSIYYRRQSMEVGASALSATSLRYNALRFEIAEQGKYEFKVFVSDSSGNTMQYYYEKKLVNVSSGNIWEIEEIPTFTFNVGYDGAKIEPAGEQAIGYRDSTYSFSSFEIIGLSGYESEYTLYRFVGTTDLSYSDLVKNTASYMDAHPQDFIPIKEYDSNVTEDDEARWNRTDNKYHWNPDSALSFVPQEATYYVLKLVVREARLPVEVAPAYQVVDVRNQIDPIPYETEWLDSNITSVVLFSISAVLLIIIVVLFVVKPSEKSVEEVDLETLRGKKHKKEKEDR